ncbi:PP2C family serine/threonine-protein phosphatase, partial [Frankia sp. CIT1]|uniref:PP2C family protein-serine/threonine phosphatase n=1 Tax=Frankia sp. CIT1 TaxID=2880974 RepID=UPI001EF47EAB
AATAMLCAQVTARIAARYGGLAGILTAGAMIADPGADDEPDAVALVAVSDTNSTVGDLDGTVVSWVGDCRAYGLIDGVLHQYTTDHTVGQQLCANGVPVELAEQHNNWVRTSLRHATVATVYEVVIPPGLVLLTTDGVHSALTDTDLEAIVRAHEHDPQALADAITAAVGTDGDGYRDDATAIVLIPSSQ